MNLRKNDTIDLLISRFFHRWFIFSFYFLKILRIFKWWIGSIKHYLVTDYINIREEAFETFMTMKSSFLRGKVQKLLTFIWFKYSDWRRMLLLI